MKKTTRKSETLGEHRIRLLAEGKLEKILKVRAARDAEIERHAAMYRQEEAPALQELRGAGFEVDSIWNFVNSRKKYDDALPLLASLLTRTSAPRVRGALGRALAVPEARKYWTLLLEQFKGEFFSRDRRANFAAQEAAADGLAVALSVTVTRETLPQLIELARDKNYGPTRVLLLTGIKRLRKYIDSEIMDELKSDEDLRKEISSWRIAKK